MKKMKKIIIINLVISTFLISNSAYALDILERFNKFADKMGYEIIEGEDVSPTAKIAAAVGTVLNWVLGFLGVIFMGLMIYAGLRWMMARGNEQQVNKAKETLQNAAIGLAIVAVSFAVSLFISYIVRGTGLFKG